MIVTKELLIYIGLACTSGVFNIIASWQELDKRCRFLPFFKPLQTFGFWIWLVTEFAFPIILFLIVFPFSKHQNFDWHFILMSIAFGINFLIILNAKTEIGDLPVDIKSIHDFILSWAYKSIARKETSRTWKFWKNIEVEFDKYNENQLETISNSLKDYVSTHQSISSELKDQEPSEILKIESQEKAQARENKKEDLIGNIMASLKTNVMRKDLQQVLQEFKFSEEIIKQIYNTRK